MSDLHRSAMHARISKLPQLPADPEDEDEDEDEEEGDSLGSLPTGLGPPALPAHTARTHMQRPPNPTYAPLSAEGCFASAAQAAVPARALDARIYYTPPAAARGTVLVCHHGAGYSGLSFACFAREVASMTRGECGVLAVDARRHGKTTSTDEGDQNLSIEVLTDDLVELLQTVFPDAAKAPTLLLVGHSMGGAVVVRACPRLLERKHKITGVAVLDVVEGTALDALPHMNSILNARPDGFGSPAEAIEWHVKTNTIRNAASARISIPSIVCPSSSDAPGAPAYAWRTPLRSTAPYWSSWFTGLSDAFLAVRAARLLVLAGTDRLDRPLTIGQMQGKFQLAVVPSGAVGHMLHEDDPTRLAEILVEFWRRNERVIVGVKKVGEM